jgi:guanylate kinase
MLNGEEVMKEQVSEFVTKYLGPDKFKNLNEAIKGVFEKG